MTKVHAYLARIKDQEKDVIAVPDGAGRALCVSSDKHWTLTREWDELHIIAPLVEDEGNDDPDDPAVTRKEVRSVVGAHDHGDDELAVSRVNALTDRLWSLVSGDDPAVFVVRESDIAAVKVEQDEDGDWEANGDLVAMRHNTAEALRGWSLGELQMLARYEAVARAIEAAELEDRLEDRLERQAATISELQGSFLRVERERDEAWRVAGEQTRLERDRAEAAERDRDKWKARAEAAARTAAHVLGQEASDE